MPGLPGQGQLPGPPGGGTMNPTKQRLAAARVLVVGDAMLDRYWHGAVERISPEAPVPVVKVTREEERIGAAANVAYNVSTLGAQASFLRVIGRQQQLLRMDFENEPDHEVLALQNEAFAELVQLQDAVLFSDYGKGGLAHIPAMITSARAAGKVVLVDPKGHDYGRYRGASVITPNRAELQDVIGRWSSEEELVAKAQNLRTSLDLDALLLTRSEEGMTLFDAQGQLTVKAQAREVFDVTGAGDTVIATLATMAA